MKHLDRMLIGSVFFVVASVLFWIVFYLVTNPGPLLLWTSLVAVYFPIVWIIGYLIEKFTNI